MTKPVVRAVLATVAVWSATAIVSHAQQTATSSETKTFEVLAVEGNTLVVRLPEGTRELTVADDFRFTIDGQQLSVRQLKAGDEGHGDHYHEDHDESRHRDRSEEWNRRDADGDVDHRAHR